MKKWTVAGWDCPHVVSGELPAQAGLVDFATAGGGHESLLRQSVGLLGFCGGRGDDQGIGDGIKQWLQQLPELLLGGEEVRPGAV